MNVIAKITIISTVVIIGAAICFFAGLPEKPTYHGKNLDQWLKKLNTGTNATETSLTIIRTTKDVNSGNVEFELPLSYDLLMTNGFLEIHGRVYLMAGENDLPIYYERATNGNLIVGCSINDFAAGTNQVQAEFFIFNPSNRDRPLYAKGPATQIISSNVVRISPQISFISTNTVVLWADLSVDNAGYRIELLDTNNKLIKTITGHTSNGTINARWNLMGDSGKVYPPDAFGVIYHVFVTNLSGTVTQSYKIGPP